MARELKIDILVDEHGATETLNKVAAAEDNVVISANKVGSIFDKMSVSTKTVATDVRGLDESFGRISVSGAEADKYLSDLHVTASQLPGTFAQVRGGLNDLAAGAGLTVEQLGALNSAGLVIGTAYAGWRIGRAAAEFLGLDDTIAQATASLLGHSVAAETAAAKHDALAIASQRAGRDITSMDEALQESTTWLKNWNDGWARLNAPEESRKQIAGWQAEIEQVRAAGVLPSLTADLESHNFSHGELAERYRISTGALGLFQRQLQDSAASWKGYDDFVKDVTKSLDAHNRALDAATEKVHALENGGDHAFSTLHQWYGEMARDQKYWNDLADEGVKKIIAEQAAVQKFIDDELKAAQAEDAKYQAGGRGVAGSPNDGTQERGEGINHDPNIVPISQTDTTTANRYTGASSLPGGDTRGGINYNPSAGPIRSFDLGGPTGSGGVAMLHPDEYVVPKGGALVSTGGGSVIYLSVDAKGATFEDDRALDRLADRISTRLGIRAVQRGAA